MSKFKIQEELIFEAVGDALFQIHGILLKKLKEQNIESNLLKDYIEKRKGEPSYKEILHNLTSKRIGKKFVFHETETKYSKIKISGMQHNDHSVLFFDFIEKDYNNPIRFTALVHYNLITATDVDFQRKCEDAISNGNYILCDMIELASQLLSLEEG